MGTCGSHHCTESAGKRRRHRLEHAERHGRYDGATLVPVLRPSSCNHQRGADAFRAGGGDPRARTRRASPWRRVAEEAQNHDDIVSMSLDAQISSYYVTEQKDDMTCVEQQFADGSLQWICI